MDFVVEFVPRNLVTLSNFIEFQDIRNFTFFEASGDTWHDMWCICVNDSH